MDKKRILIFEDSDVFAGLLTDFLTEQGYETARAKNGLEGVKQVYEFLPHLIVTDMETPLFNGRQSTGMLKSRTATKAIPVIMLTVLAEVKDRFYAGLAGADCCLEKRPETFPVLADKIALLIPDSSAVDFSRIKREAQRINDDAIIEMIGAAQDAKLLQTAAVGLLAELSVKLGSLEEIVRGFFDLLRNICETAICSIMIKDADGALIVFNANYAGCAESIAEDFKAIAIADFNTKFPDYQVVSREVQDFFPPGDKTDRIESYLAEILNNAGDDFASIHIGNSVKEYFSPRLLEKLKVFLSAASPIIANALRLRRMDILQKKTRSAFARYVPIDVMDEIIKKSSAQSNQSETRIVAILFSDIRNFTKISENTNAQELVNFLNAYFSLMGNEIVAEGGNIDKFIGDAIMAIFGAPKTLENAAANAVKAAIRMVKALTRVDTSGITLPDSGFGAGIGINYGECVVGNIGFQNKLDYTVIGDAVNLASRLEGVTKYYKQAIIVSENIYAAAKDEFIFRKADSVRVKGKNQPVGLYTVYAAYRDEIQETAEEKIPVGLILDREALDQYNKGLKLYAMREWETAKLYFSKALRITETAGGTDYLSELYLQRIAEHIENPPPPDWDATITMTEK